MNWQPIHLVPEGKKPILLISNAGPNGYVTDPWAGWKNDDGTWARWPHPFPPTHFCIIPTLTDYGLTQPQKVNCLVLANHLQMNVKDEEYYQCSFHNKGIGKSCAIGHAARANLNGFSLIYSETNPSMGKLCYHNDEDACVYGMEKEFGNVSLKLFLAINPSMTRIDAMDMLREWGNS